jgi:glycosyltransferase involved in cell wall biosynthesis
MGKNKPTIGYLSGGARISVHEDAEVTAARNHILSVIKVFESNGFNVLKFIVGDRLPKEFSTEGSEALTKKNLLTRFIADVIRLIFRYYFNYVAWKELNNKVDVVYERYASFQNLGAKFSKNNITWVLETNAILFEESSYEAKTLLLKGLAKYFEKKAYQKCDILVCISHELKESIIKLFNINSVKIHVIPNAVDIDKFSIKDNKKKDHIVIGYIGSLVKWQGLDLLLKTVGELGHLKNKVKIRIIGTGPEMNNLRQLSVSYEIEDQVQFLGKVSHKKVPFLLSEIDVGYCNPTHDSRIYASNFNSPMKLYEYMASGSTLLCSSMPDLLKFKNFDKYSFVIHEQSTKAMKSCIMKILEKMPDLYDLGKLARKEVSMNHTWEVRYRNLISQLEK